MVNLNILVNAIAQCLFFAMPPILWWFAVGRGGHKFTAWVGLVRPVVADRRKLALAGIGASASFVAAAVAGRVLLRGTGVPYSQFAGLGWDVLPGAFIYSFIQTAASEELFFRGFLGKRLISRFGFNAGNAAQAALFGLLRGYMFSAVGVGLLSAAAIGLVAGLAGWLIGYADEKLSGVSIVPGWVINGCGCLIVSVLAIAGVLR